MHRFFLLFTLLFTTFLVAEAQDRTADTPTVIQFSGQVVDTETMEPLPGVHIFVPKSGRGTTTNIYGYFTMPVASGDSLVVSTVGYERRHYKIPENYKKNITFVVHMDFDTQYLPELEVKPYPTEADFKHAVLTMELPNARSYQTAMGNVDKDIIRQGAYALGNDPAASFKAYQNQHFNNVNRGHMAPTSNFLNPFAWAKFFKDLKKKKAQENK